MGKWTKEDIKKIIMLATSLCIVVCFTVFLLKFRTFTVYVGKVFSALTPFIFGLVLAFLLNPVMNGCKKTLLKLTKNVQGKSRVKVEKLINTVSVIVAIVFFVAIITGLLWILIPELRDSVVSLYDQIPTYLNNIQDWAGKMFADKPELQKMVSNYVNQFSSSITKLLSEKVLPNMDTIVMTVSSGIVGGLKVVMNFFIGIIVAIYVLSSKDVLGAQGKKIIYSTFSKEHGNKILDGLEYAYSVFSGFINGKIIDSAIIGVITFVFCTIVDMPYSVLISVVIGATNIIPFFGPFIGAVPCALLLLVNEPVQCLVFIIFIVLLQQVDGNILGPLILGDSTGLSGLWVMFAIIVGGNLFGFAGMLLGVPVFACIYTLITVILRDKLTEKGMTNVTDEYKKLYRFNLETGEPIMSHPPKRRSAKEHRTHFSTQLIKDKTDGILHKVKAEDKKDDTDEKKAAETKDKTAKSDR